MGMSVVFKKLCHSININAQALRSEQCPNHLIKMSIPICILLSVCQAENIVEVRSGEQVISFNKSLLTDGIFKYMNGNTNLNDIFKKIISYQKYKNIAQQFQSYRRCLQKYFQHSVLMTGCFYAPIM